MFNQFEAFCCKFCFMDCIVFNVEISGIPNLNHYMLRNCTAMLQPTGRVETQTKIWKNVEKCEE
jgi:hypothetical protein